MENEFVKLNHIYKVYPNGVEAVHDFSFDVEKHDFIVIVGPSGCGKSTTLRMVAGLEDISKGELYIDGVLSNVETPKDRNIAMVFQSYSLYPHMTVRDNIAFGLKMRKIPEIKKDKNGNNVTHLDTKEINRLQKDIQLLNENILEAQKCEPNEFLNNQIKQFKDEIISKEHEIETLKNNPVPTYVYRKISKEELNNKVQNAAQILELTEYLDRHPYELSGGQRQRVALGRAIVRNAKIFLMDEPLSNLDAKLRASMRSEIIKLHRDLNATIIYVTHDQTEAMTMATKIVVMNHGIIQQTGTPKEIYNSPSNTFVANFIGSPAMNIIHATYQKGNLVFDDGNTICLESKYVKMHDNFYNNEISKLEGLLKFLNSDVENEMYHLVLPLDKFLGNENKLKVALINEQKNVISKLLNQISENHNFVKYDEKELEDYIIRFENYKNDVKALLKANNFDNIPSFEYSNDVLNTLIQEDTNRINECLNIIKENINLFNNSNNLIETLFERLLFINEKNCKPNKNEINTLLKNAKDQILFGGVLSIKKSVISKLIKTFDKPLSLDNATIKDIYESAVKINSKSELLEYTLELIDSANKSKKVTNLLSNELILKNLINGLLDNYKSNLTNDHKILFGIRPEDIHIDNKENRNKYGNLSFELKIDICETLGKEYIIHSHIGNESLQAELKTEADLDERDTQSFLFNKDKFSLFDSVSTKRINKE